MNDFRLKKFVEQVLVTAQAGLTFSVNHFDIERFNALRESAAEFLSSSAECDVQTVRDWISLDRGYPTPKLDVRAFVVNEQDEILLVQEKSDSCWTLPGGWSDIGESPAEAVAREVFEETGLKCRPIRLLALFDKHKHAHPPQMPHAYKAFFLCDVSGSLLQETDETSAAAYFHLDKLPRLSEHRVIRDQIETLFKAAKSGQMEALFD